MTNILKVINERMSLVLATALLGSALISVFVLWPMARHLQDLDQQGRLMAQDIKRINGLIKTTEDIRLGPQLIAIKDVSLVMDEITALGDTHAINFLSVVSQERTKSLYKKISTQPIDLETRSSYRQLGLFMNGLNDLRRGIVLVESFQVVSNEQSPQAVKAKMRLHICLKEKNNGKK